jgi:hypothetical protein
MFSISGTNSAEEACKNGGSCDAIISGWDATLEKVMNLLVFVTVARKSDCMPCSVSGFEVGLKVLNLVKVRYTPE